VGISTVLSLALWVATPLSAAAIEVPNGSFESPMTEFADPRIDSWEMPPRPFWYDESEFPWNQLTGVFLNPPPEAEGHIPNADGAQALFLFAVPEVGLFQDYRSGDWANPGPMEQFDVRYEEDRSYKLTVGVLGGGGAMADGVTLAISLYYRDAEGERVSVATTSITNAPGVFVERAFVDFHVDVPTVQPSDPWAGQHLGIQLLSTVQPGIAGGYWDIDNVRLVATGRPVLVQAGLVDERLRFLVQGDVGQQFEVLATDDVSVPPQEWTSLGTVTNTSGSVEFIDPEPASGQRYYQVRSLP
jgi:hypothetical protein